MSDRTDDEIEHEAASRTEEVEAEMDVLIGYILLGGVLGSAALLVAGLIWRWIATGSLTLDYTISHMNFFEFLVADVRGLFGGTMRPRLLVSLGIAVLMLTPYVRVAASVVFFLLAERNWKYTLFTAFVLAVLTYSLFLR